MPRHRNVLRMWSKRDWNVSSETFVFDGVRPGVGASQDGGLEDCVPCESPLEWCIINSMYFSVLTWETLLQVSYLVTYQSTPH